MLNVTGNFFDECLVILMETLNSLEIDFLPIYRPLLGSFPSPSFQLLICLRYKALIKALHGLLRIEYSN